MHDHADQPKLLSDPRAVVEFDADFSPDHEVNRRAAAARRVRFDPRSGYYKDEDGCARLDRFGQPL